MSIKSRIEKVEAVARPKKTACFIVRGGRANGRAWWNESISWENLSRSEYENTKGELEAQGAEVITINIVKAMPDGVEVDGWEVVNHEKTY